MPRIYAVIANLVCVVFAVRYALVARYPLLEMLIAIAAICLLHLALILFSGFIPRDILRYLKQVAKVCNIALGFLLLPLGVLLLYFMTKDNNTEGVAAIIMMCATTGIVLLMIVLNHKLTQD